MRRARAPVPIVRALEAILWSAEVVKLSFMPERSKRVSYWVMRELRGSVRMRRRREWLREESAVVTGMRPTSSGMKPNFCRSEGVERSRGLKYTGSSCEVEGVAEVKNGRCFLYKASSSEPGAIGIGWLDVSFEEELLPDEMADALTGCPKPIEDFEIRSMTILLSPTKAPENIKRILSVLTL